MINNFEKSNVYRNEIHQLIPGGAHTYSKGDDQFPALSPAAFTHGKDAYLWDLDGNKYIDCAMSLGSICLGHAYPRVIDAVQTELFKGVNFQRPASIERDLAKEFIAMIPGAERVKFAKNGSTVTSAAVKLARAFTNRDLVAFPGNHSFYSADDWFIGKTVCNSGVPEISKGLAVTYHSQKPETLAALFKKYPGRISCVITEPEEVIPTSFDALFEVVSIARANGALFIADEMVTGFRAGWPGACARIGLIPDLSTWGKAIANGFSFCALTGRAEIMDLGGIKQIDRPRVFLISTTHGAETHALAAGSEVLKIYQSEPVLEHQAKIVKLVADGMTGVLTSLDLRHAIEVHASSWRVVTVYRDGNGVVSAPLRTLMMQEMIRRGILFQGLFLPCYSHNESHAEEIISSFSQACAIYKNALKEGVGRYLVGSPTQPVFRRYNGCKISCPDAVNPCPNEAICLSN
jgi:glutamate-1-semialdehyde 2,1-aminomutase